jgi:F-type H+-transporting ATPase subunit b
MATDATGGGRGTGMPQLDFSSFPNQIFWLVVTIVVIYLILDRVALPRISAILAQRRGTLANDIAAAEELTRKAAEAEEARQRDLAAARAEGARIVAQMKAEMQTELDRALAAADAEIGERTAESERRIAAIRAEADDSVAEVARETAAAIVAALGGKADGRSVAAAVTARQREGGAA